MKFYPPHLYKSARFAHAFKISFQIPPWREDDLSAISFIDRAIEAVRAALNQMRARNAIEALARGVKFYRKGAAGIIL